MFDTWGLKQEDLIFDVLKQKWKGIMKTKGAYDKFDFESDSEMIEVKSRKKVGYATYPTTQIACDKLVKEGDKDTYFVFNFVIDPVRELKEIYYIKYDEDKFKNYETKLFRRTDRGSFDRLKKYCYIPREDLTFLWSNLDPSSGSLLFSPRIEKRQREKERKPHPCLLNACMI